MVVHDCRMEADCRRLFIAHHTLTFDRVFDGRTKRGGQQCNFYIHYEVDDDEVPTVLPLEAYGIDEECGWWLLEETGANG